MVKVNKNAKIEAGNLMEEAAEIFENCVQCGMREKRGFSWTLRWWDASLVGRFAGGTAIAWLGLGQSVKFLGSVSYGG